MFLLGYVSEPSGWREFIAPLTSHNDLFEAIVSGLAVHARRARESGLLHAT